MHGIIMMKDLIKWKIITSDLNGMVSKESSNMNDRNQYYVSERRQVNLME